MSRPGTMRGAGCICFVLWLCLPGILRGQQTQAPADQPRPAKEQPGALLQVTVAQLIDLVRSSTGKRDSDVAKELERLQLTERMSTPKLTVLSAELRGEKSKTALMALADASAFLSPAAADVVSQLLLIWANSGA